jgi:hypothetical protein
MSPSGTEMPDMEKLMKSNPSEYGYINGIWDGQASARDSTAACTPYNSTADINECYHGYDLGFKKGCDSNHDPNKHTNDGEYPSC